MACGAVVLEMLMAFPARFAATDMETRTEGVGFTTAVLIFSRINGMAREADS